MNSTEHKIWDIYRELIVSVNGLVIWSVIFRNNRDPENIPSELWGNSQSFEDLSKKYGEYISQDLKDWFHEHSQSFEDWSKKLREMSYSEMASLTEEQQRQRMIDALQGFESVMREGSDLAKDFVTEDNEDCITSISNWFANICDHYKNLQG